MSESDELSISELRRKRQQTGGSASARPQPASARVIEVDERAGRGPDPVDPLPPAAFPGRLRGAVQPRWHWLILVAFGLGLIGLVAGYLAGRYTASVTLVQSDTTSAFAASPGGESFKPRQFSAATMIGLMASPELARTVAAEASPPVSEAKLRESIAIRSAAQTELVTVTLSGRGPEELVHLLNLYAKEAVALTREIQREESTRMNEFFKTKLRELDAELENVRGELEGFQKGERVSDPEAEAQTLLRQLGDILSKCDSARLELELLDLKAGDAARGGLADQSALVEKINKARERLSSLRTRYTEAHPEVLTVHAEIAELERQLAGGTNDASAAGAVNLAIIEVNARKTALAGEIKKYEELRDSLQKKISGLSQKGLQYQLVKARQDSLLKSRQLLASRQREAQLYEENALGYYRVLAKATLADVSGRGRLFMGFLGLAAGVILGLGGGVTGAFLVEISDDRLRTAADVRRVTGLPLLATLGELNKLSPEEKNRWAFRTWTIINGKLDRAPDRGLVCGFISATEGEGKSTWIDLLAGAAIQRGLRVLKIIARASGEEPVPEKPDPPATGSTPAPVSSEPGGGTAGSRTDPAMPESANAVIANALTRPVEVTKQLAGPQAVEVPLPNWVWNLERRHQWQSALARWVAVDNVVILVELPAASLPEAVLLAENVPQLIWLVGSGKAHGKETRLHLETLKHAHCQIIGAVLNNVPISLHNV